MIGLLRDRVDVYRPTPGAASSTGTIKNSYAVLTSAVPASIQPRSGSFRQREFGNDRAADYRGFFWRTADVKEGDRIVHGLETYEVTFVAKQFGGHHFEVDLARVGP